MKQFHETIEKTAPPLQQTDDIPGARAALTEAARLDPKRFGPPPKQPPPLPTAPPPREVNPAP